ncbi:MAG: response regulator transcription factor [Ignavibacteriales bacterium]|nr:response regulator transcription factor [Ignavibacteriaceae bacterium]QOJ28034.1 MAG: response regulator transcription factor [Ignavibacteriales bacterium]
MTKILSVDDNPRVRKMIASLLKNRYDQFIEAEDGDEALELYKSNRPDYVIMDLEMKNVDGLTATKNIINYDPLAHVIILTAHETSAFRDAAISAGASAFLGKDNLIMLTNLVQNHNSI